MPVIPSTLIRLDFHHLPRNAIPKPLWSGIKTPDLDTPRVQKYYQVYLRRSDLEQTFGLLKQTLSLNASHITSRQADDIWTWPLVAAHTQPTLVRKLASDLRRPWEKVVVEHHKLSPAHPVGKQPSKVK